MTQKASPFGVWLKKWRKARQLTQSQLGEKAGCAYSLISMYERGVRQEVSGQYMRPEPELVERLATALGRPVEEGRMLAGYNASPVPITMKELEQMHKDNPGAAIYISQDNPQGVVVPMDILKQILDTMNQLKNLHPSVEKPPEKDS
jgi:transcriptional regulator with XRE-family HTH domain